MFDLLVYLEKLELLAFFSAFPLYYLLVHFITNELSIQKKWVKAMPNNITLVYAIVTLLYFGMKLNQIFEMHVLNFDMHNYMHYFKIWALLGLVFFIPFFANKKKWVLFHSFPFIGIILVDFVRFFFNGLSKDAINNEMRLYFTSLLLQTAITLILSFFKTIFTRNSA